MRVVLFAVFSLAAALAVYLATRAADETALPVGRSEGGASGDAPTATVQTPARVERVEVADAGIRTEGAPIGVAGTELFGERWDDVVAAWNERGFDLDPDRRIQPWDDQLAELLAGPIFDEAKRAGMVRTRMQLDTGTSELTDDWLFERARIPSSKHDEYDEIARAGARGVAAEHNQEMRPIAERYVDTVERIFRDRLLSDQIVRSPFGIVPDEPRLAALVDGQPEGEDWLHGQMSSSGDWAWELNLFGSNCPELVQLRDELELAWRARDAAIKAALDS